jgi:hypothetical protein
METPALAGLPDEAPPAETPPSAVAPPVLVAAQAAGGRKQGRADWAAEQAAANRAHKQRRLAVDADAVSREDASIDIVDKDECILCDGVFVDLQQPAGTFFGTLFHALDDEAQAVDYLSGYQYKYKDSNDRLRKLNSAADYETFKKDVNARDPVRACRAAGSPRTRARPGSRPAVLGCGRNQRGATLLTRAVQRMVTLTLEEVAAGPLPDTPLQDRTALRAKIAYGRVGVAYRDNVALINALDAERQAAQVASSQAASQQDAFAVMSSNMNSNAGKAKRYMDAARPSALASPGLEHLVAIVEGWSQRERLREAFATQDAIQKELRSRAKMEEALMELDKYLS